MKGNVETNQMTVFRLLTLVASGMNKLPCDVVLTKAPAVIKIVVLYRQEDERRDQGEEKKGKKFF